MAQFAHLVEQEILSIKKLQRILFGLVRLEAHRVRDQVGPLRTIAFTLAQATVPTLTPLLQKVFQEERHVFCYDGCCASVGRAMVDRNKKESQHSGRIYRLNSSLLHTTPLYLSLTRAIPALGPALTNLPISLADTTETWMASVDTFFKLKEDEKLNRYLPYVCKLGFLVNDSSIQEGTERFFALRNLMEFITGSRTHPLDDVVLGMAKSILQNYTYTQPIPFASKIRRDIEDCVFRHKSILIGDKTLKDTALPTKHWSLKSTLKGGCSCCLPDEIDEDELNYLRSKQGKEKIYDDPSSKKTRPMYVDGKTAFAFDPSKFS